MSKEIYSGWPALIGLGECVAVLNKKYSYSFAFGHYIVLHVVRMYNIENQKLGGIHLNNIFKLNRRRKSSFTITGIHTDLQRLGLIGYSRKRGSNCMVLGLYLTEKGKQVLSEYEGLLQAYEVKGLPVGVVAALGAVVSRDKRKKAQPVVKVRLDPNDPDSF